MLCQFEVNSRKRIDLQRIIDENPQEEVLLVTIGGCKYKLLMVSPKFLAHFSMVDKIRLGNELLDRFWGYSSADTTGVAFFLHTPGSQRLTTWRARSIIDVRRVVLELRAARAALITVKVHSL